MTGTGQFQRSLEPSRGRAQRICAPVGTVACLDQPVKSPRISGACQMLGNLVRVRFRLTKQLFGDALVQRLPSRRQDLLVERLAHQGVAEHQGRGGAFNGENPGVGCGIDRGLELRRVKARHPAPEIDGHALANDRTGAQRPPSHVVEGPEAPFENLSKQDRYG